MKLTQEQEDRVRQLETARGEITPRAVLDDAKRKDSPLHSLYDWDKNKAADAQWLHVSRLIIAAVVTIEVTSKDTFYRPTYVRDTEATGQGYRSTMALKDDPESARASLVYTLEVAAGHIRRAFDLAGPLGLADEVDALLKQVAGVQRTAKGKKAA